MKKNNKFLLFLLALGIHSAVWGMEGEAVEHDPTTVITDQRSGGDTGDTGGDTEEDITDQDQDLGVDAPKPKSFLGRIGDRIQSWLSRGKTSTATNQGGEFGSGSSAIAANNRESAAVEESVEAVSAERGNDFTLGSDEILNALHNLKETTFDTDAKNDESGTEEGDSPYDEDEVYNLKIGEWLRSQVASKSAMYKNNVLEQAPDEGFRDKYYQRRKGTMAQLRWRMPMYKDGMTSEDLISNDPKFSKMSLAHQEELRTYEQNTIQQEVKQRIDDGKGPQSLKENTNLFDLLAPHRQEEIRSYEDKKIPEQVIQKIQSWKNAGFKLHDHVLERFNRVKKGYEKPNRRRAIFERGNNSTLSPISE